MGVHLSVYRNGGEDTSFDWIRRGGDRAFALYLMEPETGQPVVVEEPCEEQDLWCPGPGRRTYYRPADLEHARQWIRGSGEIEGEANQRRLLDVIDQMAADPDVAFDISW